MMKNMNLWARIALVVSMLLPVASQASPPVVLSGTLQITPYTAIATGFEAWTYTYNETDWATTMTGLIVKPIGTGLLPGVVLGHGKGGNAVGFGQDKSEQWFAPNGYITISMELTHAGSLSCSDSVNQCGGSAENVRRGRRAMDILTSQQLIDGIGEVADRDQVFLYGNSLGSLTILELAEDVGSRARAVVMTAGGIVSSRKLAYMVPSGSVGVNDIFSPVLHMHGRLDNVIPSRDEDALNDALKLYGKEHQQVWFPNGGHSIATQLMTENQVRDFILAWLSAYYNKTVPSITSLSATSGKAGDVVTINGSYFGADFNGASVVTFNGLPATKVFWSDTQLQVVVPAGAVTGSVEVTVPVGPISDAQVEQPVVGGTRSNRKTFTVTQ